MSEYTRKALRAARATGGQKYGKIIGDDWIVFASDYSHFDSRFPGASEPIVNHAKLRDTTKRKILNDNARRLYPLD